MRLLLLFDFNSHACGKARLARGSNVSVYCNIRLFLFTFLYSSVLIASPCSEFIFAVVSHFSHGYFI